MKRITVAVAAVLLSATIIGWSLGTFTSGTTRDSGQILTLVAINLVLGLTISFGLLLIILRVFRSRLNPVSARTRRAAILTFATLGLCVATILSIVMSQSLRFLFGDLKQSSHFLPSYVGTWLVGVLLWSGLFTVAYVFHSLYEEWIGRRIRAISPIVAIRDRLQLFLKLLIGAILVWILTQLSAGDWVEVPQALIETGGGQEIGRDRSDSIVVLKLNHGPISHETYLKGILRIGAELDHQGAKVKLVLIPNDLVQSSSITSLIEKIAQQGNVVFAVPPMVTAGDNEHWVQHPTRGQSKIDWGVAGVVPVRVWNFPMRFFPRSYREYETGSEVPEAALRVVNRFRESTDTTNGAILGSRFILGSYSIGLLANGSAPIVRKLAVWKIIGGQVSWTEENDTLWYMINNQRSISLPDLAGHPFKNKIVILDPGGSPGFPARGETYGQTAAVIIHQILRSYSVTSLDSWTNWMVLAVLFLSIAVMLYLHPILASLLILVLIVGQPYLYARMASHSGLIPDVLPPVLAAFWSIPVFLLIRVFHERRRTEILERKRAEEELRTAHDMQMGLMPTEDPLVHGFQVSGLCVPAHEVGGDFFDYVWLDEDKTRLGIAMADVSGKAMKAAITAVMTSGMVYREVGTNETPKGILRKINRPIYLKTDKRIFTAMSFAVIDTKSKEMTFSNAGQMQPLLRRDGQIKTLRVEGARLPLGMVEDVEYGELSLSLQSGDLVVFYTDGIPEAMNGKNEMFGFEQMEVTVSESSSDASAKQVAATIVAKAAEFAGSALQHDDMTVVIVKVV